MKGRPSYISILLNFSRRKTESIIYCTEIFVDIFATNNFENYWKEQYIELSYAKFKTYKKVDKFKISINQIFDIQLEQKLFKQRQRNLLNSKIFVYKQVLKKTRFEYKNFKLFNKTSLLFFGSLLNFLKKTSLIFFFNYHKNFSYNNNEINHFDLWKILSKQKISSKKVINDLYIKKLKSNINYLYKKIDFKLNYFCCSIQFCFYNNYQYFLFSIFIRNFSFKKDKLNPIYSEYIRVNTDISKFLKRTGSFPIFQFLKVLSSNFLPNKIISIRLLERQIRILLLDQKLNTRFFEKLRLLQRLKIIRCFRQTKNHPCWMILSILPVLPPDLRPILQLNNDQIAISDLNKLYQKVLFRNRRLQRLLNDLYIQNVDEIQYAQRLLQEAVDALIENGKNNQLPAQSSNNRCLKSLSDMLKGKKGRFRQNLLGKRVDYSGRSVIVVGSNLKLHECGLPKEMAIELFQPFILRQLMIRKKAKTILGAKKIIQKQKHLIWPILSDVLQNHPILLNRAPTLHRLSIQAFQPILVEGKAILLHPLVCSAFNADFDGDQMAVHIPLSFESRAEAWKLLWSVNNGISSATGQPILLPSQDMVLGSNFLTLRNIKYIQENLKRFGENDFSLKYSENIYYRDDIHDSIWFRWDQYFETQYTYQQLYELKITKFGKYTKIYPNIHKNFSSTKRFKQQLVLTTIGRILFSLVIQKSI